MQFRHLRHFLALVEHGGFVRAASAVCLSQPAFSRSIQVLERELGCSLLDRTANGLALTGQGEILRRHAEILLRDLKAATDEIAHYDGRSRQLNFGSGPGPAASFVPRAIAAFMERHAKVRLNCAIASLDDLATQLRREEIEFLVADYRHFQHDPQYRIEKLQPRRGGVFCRNGHPLLEARTPVQPAELARYQLVSMNILGRDVPNPASYGRAVDLECNTLDALVSVVRGSDAIGIAALDGVTPHLRDGGLQLLPLDDTAVSPAILTVHYGIVSRVRARLSPAAMEMLNMIREVDGPAPISEEIAA